MYLESVREEPLVSQLLGSHKPPPNPSWLFNSILIVNLLAHGGTGALAL